MGPVKIGDRFESMRDADVTCEVIGFAESGWARIKERRDGRPDNEIAPYISDSIDRSGLREGQKTWRPQQGAAAMSDPIKPSYYKRAGIEAFDVIDAFELTYHVGAATAYLLRAGKKTPDAREDIAKAIRHLQRELARLGAAK